jgi:hypothetical protein
LTLASLQKGQRFFTIGDNMHLARASRVAKGREREVNIGWIILYQQYSDGSFSSGHKGPRLKSNLWPTVFQTIFAIGPQHRPPIPSRRQGVATGAGCKFLILN